MQLGRNELLSTINLGIVDIKEKTVENQIVKECQYEGNEYVGKSWRTGK